MSGIEKYNTSSRGENPLSLKSEQERVYIADLIAELENKGISEAREQVRLAQEIMAISSLSEEESNNLKNALIKTQQTIMAGVLDSIKEKDPTVSEEELKQVAATAAKVGEKYIAQISVAIKMHQLTFYATSFSIEELRSILHLKKFNPILLKLEKAQRDNAIDSGIFMVETTSKMMMGMAEEMEAELEAYFNEDEGTVIEIRPEEIEDDDDILSTTLFVPSDNQTH